MTVSRPFVTESPPPPDDSPDRARFQGDPRLLRGPLPTREPLLKLRATGRGTAYTRRYGVLESILRFAYAFDWPARAWGLVPRSTDVEVVRRTLPLLPKRAGRSADARLRLGFASDLHFGPTTPRRTLERARALLCEARPDVLLLGGDYVFLGPTRARMAALEAWVAAIPARTKLAVLGNHDLWTEHAHVEAALHRGGARVLVNDAVRLPAPFDDVAIVGVDEPWTGQPDGACAVRAAGDAPLKLGLAHAPEAIPHLRGRGVSMLLCGHTHGGMVALPGARPLVVYGEWGRRFPHGVHRVDDLDLFVSRGLGGVEIPVRTFAPPDVGVFDLVVPT